MWMQKEKKSQTVNKKLLEIPFRYKNRNDDDVQIFIFFQRILYLVWLIAEIFEDSVS